jgi:hypothetical protein
MILIFKCVGTKYFSIYVSVEAGFTSLCVNGLSLRDAAERAREDAGPDRSDVENSMLP